MFKKKKLFFIGLLFVIITFSGCSNKVGVNELFDKFKNANNNIESILLLNEIINGGNGSSTKQILKGELINDKDSKKITKGKVIVRYSGSSNIEQNNYDVEFVGDESKTSIMTRKINGVDKKTEKQNSNYDVFPDYFRLLEGIYSFTENDLTLEEVNDEYHLKIKNDDNNKSKIINILKAEYKLNLKKISENDVTITFEAVFDKDTYYLKNVFWTLEHVSNNETTKITNTTSFSKWNDVNLDK
ncbi:MULTISPECIES: hypothetical protein [unclassified Parvimonas]|uniref:hypothetical protein n=1 Tax=unclassified Parvimonas TaxID=1151464 RepID=UPI002B474E4A|nr:MULTISPECIES: hypothetical protein [unclassified Parvimonas]MEB3025763.1 hypothetical protein [Parvimonas sp. M13]MEB3072426.1 hypothetical protein [Parvimonas sp. C2]MEB3089910.1 hypothetical protein [Parvimonas sp. M20]